MSESKTKGTDQNPQETAKSLQLQTSVLENQLNEQRTSRELAEQLVMEFRKQLRKAAEAVEKKSETQKSRIDFLTRTLEASAVEQEALLKHIQRLEHEREAQNDKYEQQVDNLRYQAREIESNYKVKIENALGKLRDLKEFQEKKHELDERMRNLGELIAKERKERTAELAQVHRKLTAQREYYEKKLTASLFEIDRYVTTFEDVDLDRITTKVLHETEQKREDLKAENALTFEVLKRNDQLRHQMQNLEQQKKILEDSEKTLTSQVVDLKSKLEDTTKKVDESLEASKTKLEQLKESLNEKVSELQKTLHDAKKESETLKREVALAEKQLELAEEQRDEKLKKDHNLLSVMSEASLFILTSLELQEKDPTKEDIAAHAGALNAVIRKISNVTQDLTGVQQKETDSKAARSDATLKKTLNRRTSNPNDFKGTPEFQRLFGATTGNASKAKLFRVTKMGK